MKKFIKWPLLAAVCIMSASVLVSCDDEKDPINPPTILDFKGNYEGTMKSTSEGTEIGSDAIAMELTGDTVVIANMPVKALVESVVGKGDTADEIVAGLGNVNYKIGYTYSAKADNSAAEITMAPKELILTLGELEIKVEISAVDKGAYDAGTKKLTFALAANKVFLNGTEFEPFKSIEISVDATKK